MLASQKKDRGTDLKILHALDVVEPGVLGTDENLDLRIVEERMERAGIMPSSREHRLNAASAFASP